MMYGHVDNPSHWVGHLRTLSRIQDETAASPSSCCCRSSTPTRPSTSPASPARARPHRRTVRCTRSHGSCCTAASTTSRRRGSSSEPRAPSSCCRAGRTTWAAPSWRRPSVGWPGPTTARRRPSTSSSCSASQIGREAYQRTTTYGVPSAERAAVARAPRGDGLRVDGQVAQAAPAAGRRGALTRIAGATGTERAARNRPARDRSVTAAAGRAGCDCADDRPRHRVPSGRRRIPCRTRRARVRRGRRAAVTGARTRSGCRPRCRTT